MMTEEDRRKLEEVAACLEQAIPLLPNTRIGAWAASRLIHVQQQLKLHAHQRGQQALTVEDSNK